jgi:hypothetical protein
LRIHFLEIMLELLGEEIMQGRDLTELIEIFGL